MIFCFKNVSSFDDISCKQLAQVVKKLKNYGVCMKVEQMQKSCIWTAWDVYFEKQLHSLKISFSRFKVFDNFVFNEFVTLPSLLDFRIRVGPTLIYFGKFSHAYALIRVPTFNSFWETSDGTLWHRSHPEQIATSQCKGFMIVQIFYYFE